MRGKSNLVVTVTPKMPEEVPATSPAPSPVPSDADIARLAVELGLVTRSEADALRPRAEGEAAGHALIESGLLTAGQLERLLARMDSSRRRQIPGYEILERAGRGAMATVYKARQISLARIVAIKVLPRRLGDNPEFVTRFYEEGRAAARLSHNNVVQAIDVACTPEGVHYFVMEYVEGKTLYDMMTPPPAGMGHRFSETEVVAIGMQIADALSHAHQRGLIHRDVKPKNIIMTPDNVAKLTDLGLARAMDDTAQATLEQGKAYGTPYYISPEQIRGELNVDARADIYSLGATLYHLLTGRPPFDAPTPRQVMQMHLTQVAPPVDHLVPKASSGLAAIIECCMAKRPGDRYMSAADLLDDLRAVSTGGMPIHASAVVDLTAAVHAASSSVETIDLNPHRTPEPTVATPVIMAVALAASILVNVVLIVLYFFV